MQKSQSRTVVPSSLSAVPKLLTARPRRSTHSLRLCASAQLPASVQGPQTDEHVPAGHASLHAALYGDGGAEAHDSQGLAYRLRQDQDDGSQLVPVHQWLQDRDSEKPLGVYALYSAEGRLQYIGFSRNTVTAIRGHLTRAGPELCASVRSMVFANKAMLSRELLEREAAAWAAAAGGWPPGNGPERAVWEASAKVLSPAELAEYEEKAAKMRRAMGEGREEVLAGTAAAASGGTVYSAEELRQKREDMMRAVEGDNWSAVIDQQTQQALGQAHTPLPHASGPPSASSSSNGNRTKAAAGSPTSASNGSASSSSSSSSSSNGDRSAAGVAASSPSPGPSSGPLASPFASATVHRRVGEKGQASKTVDMTIASVDAALEEVRPYLMADGGDVEVVEVKDGYVYLRLQGSCSTCVSSQSTMKMGIERALKAAFGDALLEVVQVDKVDVATASVANINAHLDMLRGAIHNFGGSVEVVEVQGSACTVLYKVGPWPCTCCCLTSSCCCLVGRSRPGIIYTQVLIP
ncbi:NifU-domain-containing protein [Haematococcus lacustris]